MLRGGVALVTCESVLRIYRIHLIHILISRVLRQDRRGADRRLRGIPADDRARAQGQPKALEPRQTVAVDEQPLRAQAHGQHRAAHREKGGVQDVERVDFGRVRPADAEAKSAPAYRRAQARPGLGTQHLRIRDAGDGAARTQNHRRGHHRPRQRSAPRLIDAGDSRSHGTGAGRLRCTSPMIACAARALASRLRSR